MSIRELLILIEALPLNEQKTLLEALQHSIREKTESPRKRTNAAELKGLFKTDGPAPTDEEVKESYVNYLIEKYM